MEESFKRAFSFRKQCAEYGISLWQCPNFVFLLVGAINALSLVATYFAGTRLHQPPEVIIPLTVFLSAIFFIIGQNLTSGLQKLAEANKMKIEFVSIASHQLKTPLSSIRWLLTLVLKNDQNLDPETRSFLLDIRQSNERLIKLVNDLLNVNRIETGELSFRRQEINLAQAAQRMIRPLEKIVQASNIKLRLEAPANALISFDQEKLDIILQNLLENAIKYTKKDGRPHTVQIKIQDQGENYSLSVRDEGVGIPAKDHKFIFQKFFRSDNVLKHQTVGTGLGLYLVKSLAEMGGGRISFESRENEGSVFSFSVPKVRGGTLPSYNN